MIAGLGAVAVIAGLACAAALLANRRANSLASVAQRNLRRRGITARNSNGPCSGRIAKAKR